jgi:membrane protein required for colicin V production
MDSLPVNATDLVIFVVLLISALLAFARGFVHELLSIVGWIGAIFATIYGYPYLKPFARDLIAWKIVADITAGAVIFIVSLIVLSVISKQVRTSALNALDRALGFLFGILRGAVVVCLVYIGIEWMWPPKDQPNWLRSARTITLVENGAALLKSFVPQSTRDKSKKAAQDAEQKIRKKINERIYKEMVSPSPKKTSEPLPEGYGSKERRDMNRLIEGSQ